jgi:septal ring factor EnvC (AmiA/AmiB activator)
MVNKTTRGMTQDDIAQVKRDHMNQSDRLDRIEEKIDRMSEAIISLARAEEKITTLTSFSKQQNEMIIELTRRMEKLEGTVTQNAVVVNVINKVFWIIMVASATAITGMLVMQ